MSNNNNDDTQWGMGVLGFGIITIIVCVICCGPMKQQTPPEPEYVYYNVPVYTTVYEIVYPDSIYRYTVVHHSPTELSSSRGSNYLYSRTHTGAWADHDEPEYWLREWNKDEIDISTTAPIRIVSETVKYEKKKYPRKR